MANTPQVNSNNLQTSLEAIQTLIDSKIALIATLVATINTVLESPKPNYFIDNQEVEWGTYLKNLGDMQCAETKALEQLIKSQQTIIKTQNMVLPYQFQSCTAGGFGYGWRGGVW